MRWLEQLEKRKDDRGLLAALRCALIENKLPRAYPALSRLGIALDNDARIFTAGIYALHPLHKDIGNFGETCRRLNASQPSKGTTDDKISPVEKRFQHLLSAERHEVFSRIRSFALYAKAKDVPIDYEKLENDLHYWGERTKRAWAMAFWRAGEEDSAPTEEGGAA